MTDAPERIWADCDAVRPNRPEKPYWEAVEYIRADLVSDYYERGKMDGAMKEKRTNEIERRNAAKFGFCITCGNDV